VNTPSLFLEVAVQFVVLFANQDRLTTIVSVQIPVRKMELNTLTELPGFHTNQQVQMAAEESKKKNNSTQQKHHLFILL